MNKLFPLLAFSVLLLVPVGVQNAFGDDLNPPTWRGEENSLYFEWNSIDQFNSNSPDVFSQGPSSFPLSQFGGGNQGDIGTLARGPPGNGDDDFVFVSVVNFVDGLDKKIVRIQVTYSANPQSGFSSILSASEYDQNTGDNTAFSLCELIDHVDVSATHFYEDWLCEPNPDAEFHQVELFGGDQGEEITQLVMDTISFDDEVVGGELLPIDSTTLMLAGLQSSAIWMLPV